MENFKIWDFSQQNLDFNIGDFEIFQHNLTLESRQRLWNDMRDSINLGLA